MPIGWGPGLNFLNPAIALTPGLAWTLTVTSKAQHGQPNVPQVSVTSNFFRLPGGASLSAVLVVQRLRERGVEIPSVAWLMSTADLAELATKLAPADGSEAPLASRPWGEAPSRGGWTQWRACFFQIMGILLLGNIVVGVPVIFVIGMYSACHYDLFVVLFLPIVLLAFILSILIVCALKWLVLGRLRPAAYPVYSCRCLLPTSSPACSITLPCM